MSIRLPTMKVIPGAMTPRSASLYNCGVFLANSWIIQSSKITEFESRFSTYTTPYPLTSENLSQSQDQKHLSLAKSLCDCLVANESGPLYVLFWNPAIPASGIDAALALWRRAAGLIPPEHTADGTRARGEKIALERMASLIHREISYDDYPYDREPDGEDELQRQLNSLAVRNENVRHRALWARIYSKDMQVLPMSYPKRTLYQSVQYLDYCFKFQLPLTDRSDRRDVDEFIAGCIMFRGMAATLRDEVAKTTNEDEEDDYRGRIEVWQTCLEKLKLEYTGEKKEKVNLHAALALKNIEEGCRDETSWELFDEIVWVN